MYVRYTTGERELYDMRTDQYQLQNLAGDPGVADLAARLSKRLDSLCVPEPPGLSGGGPAWPAAVALGAAIVFAGAMLVVGRRY